MLPTLSSLPSSVVRRLHQITGGGGHTVLLTGMHFIECEVTDGQLPSSITSHTLQSQETIVLHAQSLHYRLHSVLSGKNTDHCGLLFARKLCITACV